MKLRRFLFVAACATVSLGVVLGTETSTHAQSAGGNSRALVHKTAPRYPEVARKMNISGTVKVIAVVAPDGKVKSVEPVGGSPLLIEAAKDAITQWKFATAGAESRETIELHFNPDEP
jgi:TonB family protein